RVHNSILDATGAACDNLPAVPPMRFNLVTTTGGCPATDNQVIDTSVPAQQLLATPDSSGRCSAAFGLLCPSEYEAETGVQAIRLYVPRVLASYTDFDASPIINKGAPSTGSAETFCPNNDMRGNARTANACDIGSVEWQALATAARTGGVMKQSQANFTPDYADYLDLLGDEELLPAAECPAAPYTAAIPGSYRPDLPGCPWLESTPTRGTVTFAANGAYQYTPSVRFHGFDDFKVRVITTASRLNAQPLTRSRVLDANVIVEPDSGIKSENLGGSVGAWYILYLAMAAIGLRGRRGR
ncbi:MAG: choice-of-anchor Q domain-containing protein, partial [Moraxellaceae bacterium]